MLEIERRTKRSVFESRLQGRGVSTSRLNDWLLFACGIGDLDGVNECLAAGADIEARDGIGVTPLMTAAQRGHRDIAAALIDAGADLATTDKHGRTALLMAVWSSNGEMVAYLLEAGADPEERIAGQPLLVCAADRSRGHIVKLLIDAGADIEAVGDDLETALTQAAEKGNREAVEVLLAAGADIDADRYGLTALMLARIYEHTEVIALLESAALEKSRKKRSTKYSEDSAIGL